MFRLINSNIAGFNRNFGFKLIDGIIALPTIPTVNSNLFTYPDTNDNLTTPITNNLFSSINFTGSINISQSFKEHPNATLTLVCNDNNLEEADTFLKTIDQKIVLYGIPFRVISWSKQIINKQESDQGFYTITVQLEGWYNRPLNLTGRYRLTTLNGQSGTITRITGSGSGSGSGASIGVFLGNRQDYIESRDLQNFPVFMYAGAGSGGKPKKKANEDDRIRVSIKKEAEQLGIKLTGFNLVGRVANEENVYPKTGYQLQSLIDDRCRNSGVYPVYSDDQEINITEWSNPKRTITLEGDKIFELSISGLSESLKYSPRKLDWNTSEDDEDDEEDEDRSKNNEPILDRIYPQETVVTVPEDISSVVTPPKNITLIRDLSLNFDVSGETRSLEYQTYLGQTLIKRVFIKYGFAYTSIEAITGAPANPVIYYSEPAAFWRIIERTETIYNYDRDTGYLLGSNTFGTRLVRFRTETDALEVYSLNPLNAIEAYERSLFQFKTIQVLAADIYVLKQLGDFYPDERPRAEDVYLIWEDIDKNGKTVRRSKPNPTYIPKMFVAKKSSYYNSFISTPNPDNVGLTAADVPLPPLIAGEYRVGIEIVDPIADTKNERYSVTNYNYSSQDGNFANSLAIGQSTVSTGRPGIAEGIGTNWRITPAGNKEIDNTTNNNKNNSIGIAMSLGSNVTIGQTLAGGNSTSKSLFKDTYLYTDPYVTDHQSGTMFFDVESIGEAYYAANAELKENKTFNETILNVKTIFNPQLKEGDRLIIKYFSQEYITRVKDINTQITIVDNKTYTALSDITCGLESNANYKIDNPMSGKIGGDEQENEEDDDSTLPPLEFVIPYYTGKTLGDEKVITELMKLTNRGNY